MVGTALCVLILLSAASASNIGGTRQDIQLDADGGYHNILIAIDEGVPYDSTLITNLQEMLTEASKFLLVATDYQKFFKQFVILAPATWPHDRSWLSVNDESFERARILVAPANPEWENAPYAKQPGLCGTEADYVHFTPAFITDPAVTETFGPAAKTFVHEWAHLKWGLFDEYASSDLDSEFYTYRRRLYPTRCTRHIDGQITDRTSSTGSCMFDRRTGLPTDTCVFVPDTETTAKASIMFAQYLTSVVSFCSTGEQDLGQILHDNMAPNKMNRICQKSAWEVLRSLPEFQDPLENVSGRATPDPEFKIIHDYSAFKLKTTTSAPTRVPPTTAAPTTAAPTTAAPTRVPPATAGAVSTTIGEESDPEVPRREDVVCLVLDISGSMNTDNRIGKMGSAMCNYIRNYLEDGTTVGVVNFNSNAVTAATMTRILDEATRDQMIGSLPTMAGGGTSIGGGLSLCAQMLHDHNPENVRSSRIFVLSDGQENASPYVSEVLPGVIDMGITVDTIAYSQNADSVLTEIAQSTNGYSFYFSGAENSTAMQDALLATIERRRNKESPVTLLSGVTILAVGETIQNTISLDRSIGRDTRFIFTYNNNVRMTINTTNNATVTVIQDTTFNLWTVRIPGIVTGDIIYELTNLHSDIEHVVTSVTSRTAVPGADPITATGRMSVNQLTFSATSKVNVYTDVYQGLVPVLGVDVTAVLEMPSGSVFYLALYDNGAGADSTRGDGVYSGFLLSNQFSGNGYYSMKILVNGTGTLTGGQFSGARSRSCNVCKKETGTADTGPITRSASGGMFLLDSFDPDIAAQDNFAPQQIRDLDLLQAIYGEDYITLGWTAPGDDLDWGTVAGYQVRVWHDSTLGLTNITELLVPPVLLHNGGNWTHALPAGQKQNLTIVTSAFNEAFFSLDPDTMEEELDTFFFRVRGIDASGNVGEWSNEQSVSFVNPADYEELVVVTTPASAQQKKWWIGLVVGLILFAIGLAVLIVVLRIYLKKKRVVKQVDSEMSTGELKENESQATTTLQRPITPSTPMGKL